MDALRDWVKDLVVLVMLAGSLELLIPIGGMKKYVRTTMGLLVVLSVAKPVVALLGSPVSVADGDRLAGLAASVPASGLPSLGQVMEQAQRFRERNQALAARQGKATLEGAVRAALLKVPGVQQAEAVVDLEPGGAELKRVLVRVSPGPGGTPGSVQPVRPVGKGGAPEQQPLSPELEAAARRAVSAALGLEPDDSRIQVALSDQPPEVIGGNRP